MTADTQDTEELILALRTATRVNAPYDSEPGYRIVGFKLPDELAWPRDKTAFDVLQVLLDAVARPDSPVTVMREALEAAREVVASDAAACAAFAGPDEISYPQQVLTIIDEALALRARSA